MISSTYYCEFAPDGKHFIRNSTETLKEAWQFLHSVDVQVLKIYNSAFKARIVNTKTGAIVGNK